MKKLIIALLIGSLSTAAALAADKEGKKSKEITRTGEVVCAHCDLDVVSKCQKAIKTKRGKAFLLTGDKVTEFFKADATKKAKRVKVTGKRTGKEGEHVVLTASKIEEAKPAAKPKRKKKTS